MNAAFAQGTGTAHVVLPKGVAAIDDGVAALEHFSKCCDCVFSYLSGRQHHPNNARSIELAEEIIERCTGCRALRGEVAHGLGIGIVDHDLVLRLGHQATNDIAAHASEADESDLHEFVPVFAPGSGYLFCSICRSAAARTLSAAKPNFFKRSFSGADDPNVCMPMISPEDPA